MQGYILRTQKVKDEDLLVFILSRENFIKCYRFYGSRHPSVMVGYKIDFELMMNINFLPQLRNVMHLGFFWQLNREKLLIWQQFMRLLYAHIKDTNELDSFYFDELELLCSRFGLQNPKRLIIESYVRMLEHEGRLHSELECLVCESKIDQSVCLVRGFLPAHTFCLSQNSFDLKKIEDLFESKSSAELDDSEVAQLYEVVCEGL